MKLSTWVIIFSLCYSPLARSLEDPCEKTLTALQNRAFTLDAKFRARLEPLVDEIKNLQKKNGISLKEQYYLRTNIRKFVVEFQDALSFQSDKMIHELMEIWIKKQFLRVGHLPGFGSTNPGYRNLEELDKDIHAQNPWPFMNMYSNSIAGIEFLNYANGTPRFDQRNIPPILVSLPYIYTGLLIREYAIRYLLPAGDVPGPHDKVSLHQAFNSIESQLSELTSPKQNNL